MTKEDLASRCRRRWLQWGAVAALHGMWPLGAAPATPAGTSGMTRPPPLPMRAAHRLTARDIAVVINLDDPYSVAVGEFYARARGVPASQVVRLRLPRRSSLSSAEFETLRAQLDAALGSAAEALALAWRAPYAVDCQSLPGALALGPDERLCANPCAPSRRSGYFNAAGVAPRAVMPGRLSMLLAAPDEAAARALIERGMRADRSMSLRGAAANAVYVETDDAARSVRTAGYPPAGPLGRTGVTVVRLHEPLRADLARVLLFEIGRPRVEGLDRIHWLPGAIADHLTSFGGVLDGSSDQMNAMAWIAAGATASHGTVSEPCAHPQKFPHPQVLLAHYLRGDTAIEALWKSVLWPQQSLFIGEPLAAPFATSSPR